MAICARYSAKKQAWRIINLTPYFEEYIYFSALNLKKTPVKKKNMKRVSIIYSAIILVTMAITSCNQRPAVEEKTATKKDTFEFKADRFADIQVLRYRVPGFAELSLQQKQLAYYLYEAGLCGRDIFYDQKYRYNIFIRKVLENILETYNGDKNSADYKKFTDYAIEVF